LLSSAKESADALEAFLKAMPQPRPPLTSSIELLRQFSKADGVVAKVPDAEILPRALTAALESAQRTLAESRWREENPSQSEFPIEIQELFKKWSADNGRKGGSGPVGGAVDENS